MKKVDLAVLIVFVIALVVLLILQQCHLDIWAFLLGIAVAVVFGVIQYNQNKKLKNQAKQ